MSTSPSRVVVAYDAPPTAEEVARRAGIALEHVVKLDANESPYGPPPAAREVLAGLSSKVGRYPDPEYLSLRTAIGRTLDVPTGSIAVGNGLDELLGILCDTLLSSGDEAIVPVPTFSVYARDCAHSGAVVVSVPRDERFQVTSQALVQALSPKTKLIFLCAPNNPTGTPLAREALSTIQDAIRQRYQRGAEPWIVLDEAYVEFGLFTGDARAWSGLSHVRDAERVIVLRTFSKLYGLAGLRVGYAVSSPELAQRIMREKQPYNLNLAGAVAAEASLEEPAWLKARAEAIVSQRERMEAALSRLSGLHLFESAANFVLVRVAGGRDPRDRMWQGLLERGILVRRSPGERLDDCLRISVGTPEETTRLLETLTELVDEEVGA